MRISVMCFLIEPKAKSKYWGIELPVLGIHTQGTSRKDARLMAKDAVKILFDPLDLDIEISNEHENTFQLTFQANKEVFSKFLRASRISHDLTIMEVAKRLHSKSPTAYARYESGKVMPGIEKFTEILQAIDRSLKLKLVVGA